jgi:uncharacterized FlgJ-related protein
MKIVKIKKDMSYVDITLINKFKTVSLYLLSTVVIILSVAFTTIRPDVIKYKGKNTVDTVYLQEVDIPLTDSAITAELVKQDCILPNVALAQMKIETGNFTSAICKENKNIAGIRTSKSKYVSGMNRGHCSYRFYKDCIKDYVRVQNRYLKNIDGKYAENPEYVSKLKSYAK